MTSGGVYLPPEIIDMIIDHLHNDVQALHACCFLNHAWRSVSQYHLLSSVKLDLSLPMRRLEPLFDLLTSNQSSLRQSMRSLTLLCSYYGPTKWQDILPLLPPVEKLSLIKWRHVPSKLWVFREAGLFSGLKILSIEMASTDFPGFVDFAQGLPALESLQLNSFAWRSRTDADKAARAHNKTIKLFPKLKGLHLASKSGEAIPVFAILIRKGVVPYVESLQLDEIRCEKSEAARSLLLATRSTLRALVISASSVLPINFFQNLYSGGEPVLKSVHFKDLVDPRHGIQPRESVSADWAMGATKYFPSTVEDIAFSFWLIPGDDLGLVKPTRQSIHWNSLNQRLTALPKLKQVTFLLSGQERQKQWIEERLVHRLCGIRGLLSVKLLEA